MKLAIAIILLASFFFIGDSFAKTDLSITATDIVFSKDEPLAGEKVRVFARVFNLGDTDVYGFVIFLDGRQEMADPQPISVKVNTYDDVFIDWIAAQGSRNIQAKIVGANLLDDSPDNDKAVRENYFVDLDTDGDKIGNAKDLDDDNDDLSDEKEITLGTNPLKADTDGDRARDGIDIFPLDPIEWRDSDQDGLGDNKDTDDDNDGLYDDEESFIFGTNPLSPDSDNDGLLDKEEVDFGTKATLKDTDGDGAIDSEDGFPLDPKRTQASIFESVNRFIEARWLSSHKSIIIFISLLIVSLILSLYLKRR